MSHVLLTTTPAYAESCPKFVLAESQAIYRYLGRKMDILGKTDHEIALIEQFCFSWEELHEKFWPLFGRWKKILTSEQFDETLQDILHNEIKPVIMKHEEALAKNGTGFYVGDKVSSLCQIFLALCLGLLMISLSLPVCLCR
jgi:glutathione S-transferase